MKTSCYICNRVLWKQVPVGPRVPGPRSSGPRSLGPLFIPTPSWSIISISHRWGLNTGQLIDKKHNTKGIHWHCQGIPLVCAFLRKNAVTINIKFGVLLIGINQNSSKKDGLGTEMFLRASCRFKHFRALVASSWRTASASVESNASLMDGWQSHNEQVGQHTMIAEGPAAHNTSFRIMYKTVIALLLWKQLFYVLSLILAWFCSLLCPWFFKDYLLSTCTPFMLFSSWNILWVLTHLLMYDVFINSFA